MNTPIIIVNFKAYENASGKRALELAKMHEKVAKKTGVAFAIAVQATDLQLIAAAVSIPVLAQHFDPVEFGAYTGHLSPHVLKEAGAMGSLLNHAERKLPLDVIEKSVELARRLGFFTVLCADTPYAGKALSEFDPDWIAVEPPELIGGNISVATANPQLISDVVHMIGKGKVLVGAGIKTRQDVHISLDLGAGGVLLASGVTKAMDPEEVLMDLAQGEPHRLNLLLEALPGRGTLQLLEALFLDSDSTLRQEFEKRLRLLPAHRNRMLCIQVLEKVAAGVHRLPDLAEQVQKPARQVSRALLLLQEAGLLKKEGVFYRIPERLFQAWLVTAYPTLQGVGLMGAAQAQAHFRRTVQSWMEKRRQAAGRPLEEQLQQFLLQWSNEVADLDGHRTLLPKFRQVDRVPGPLNQASLLARPVKRQKGGWWVVPWRGPLDEAQARQLVQEMRCFAPLREYRKVLIGASRAEINARLVFQEAKIRFWDLSLLNRMLELYGLTRLPVPEGAEDSQAQTIPFEGESAPQRGNEYSSEVTG